MLELKTVSTIHYVMRGSYAPVPAPELAYSDLAEAIGKAVELKREFPDDLFYVETRSYVAVLGI